MRLFLIFLFIGGLCLPVTDIFGQKLSNINNPVLPGIADAGVIRYNGEYYIGGVFTNGSFYISENLTNWEGPVHVFSMDNDWTNGPSAGDSQIHANDINYVNGIFHLYWSVNYWGRDKHVVHIAHATSPDVLGPYKEPVKNTWLANRIDPHLFVDDDRKPYLYMVKFTDGNTIWGRPMKDPWTFSGEPHYLFASLPRTWETLDNRVAEGPWVIKYRNRYYMMYNANHTSTNWGNYTLGVAEADSPLGFNHGSKYPHPVVKSNQVDMEDKLVDLLKYSDKEPGVFSYTSEKPGKNWNTAGFNAASWQKGKAGFGSRVIEGSTTRKVKTEWKSPEVWARKTFILDKENAGNLMLRIHHDGATEVFLNGQPVYEHEGRQYITWNFDRKATSLLKNGENVLAIHSTKGARSNFLDVSLFDMKDQKGDDILYSPGQPNILRGPNGFEWWLIYMANKNAEHRGQYINRVHFFNKRLFVDGVTGINTSGYHPVPSLPTFSALFNDKMVEQWQSKWNISGGKWDLKNKEVVQTSSDTARALVKSVPAAHYLFEAGVKMNGQGTAKAGAYAWWKDENNWLKVVLDRQHKTWGYVKKEKGETEAFSFPLPADFNYNVYHMLSIYKNAADFTIKIDNLPAPENPVIRITGFSGKGIPGLYTEGASTAFDGVLYTIGWDEFDDNITGWGASGRGIDQKGSWLVSEEGITQMERSGENAIFKGDILDEYEVSVQVASEGNEGSAGIYPVYTDTDNYLKAAFDFKNQKLIVSDKKSGKVVEAKEISLERSQSYYADMKYTDFIEKRFTFHAPAYINQIKLNKIPHNQPDRLIEDIYKKVDIFYKREGKWHPITAYHEMSSAHPGFDKITFEPVKAEALRFVNKQAEDHNFYVYKIWVNEVFKESYNLRVAKREDAIIFLVDGKEILRMKNDFPASQVGLFTENTKASFNGITLFHLNTETNPDE
jgi:GH43 family beta-xylosidase